MAETQGFAPSPPPQAARDPRSEAITTLAQAGWSQRKIGQAFGLSQPAILKVLRRGSRATAGDPLREENTESAPKGDNCSTVSQQIEPQSEPQAEGQTSSSVPQASGEIAGRCGRVSRCQGRLWHTVTGYTFCEICDLAPRGELFARWVSE